MKRTIEGGAAVALCPAPSRTLSHPLDSFITCPLCVPCGSLGPPIALCTFMGLHMLKLLMIVLKSESIEASE